METSSPRTNLSISKCSICFTSTAKYKCPRCAAQTCSLPCVKTHKSQALCSGKRDATNYLPRRKLATEKTFDSDFNLLSGIERGVERAGRILADAEGEQHDDARARKVRRAVDEAGVNVVRAPRGVKRARENRTGVEGRQRHINWTAEWRFLGSTVLACANETMSVAEAHDVAVLDAYRAEREKSRKQMLKRYVSEAGVRVPQNYKGRKELIDELDVGGGAVVEVEDGKGDVADEPLPGVHAMVGVKDQDALDSSADGLLERVVSDVDQGTPVGVDPEQKQSPTETQAVESEDEQIHAEGEGKAVATTETTADPDLSTTVRPQDAKTKRRFFLHRPELSSASRQVVSSISGQDTIRDILRGKTVREFPTFLVEVSGLDELDWTQWEVVDT